MPTIRGILITPGEARDVTIDSDDTVTAIQRVVDCDCFTVVGLQEGIDLFVDDEGLINGSELNLALTIVAHRLGVPAVLFGRGLAVSVDEDGETVSLSETQRKLVSEALSTKPDPETVGRLAESFAPMPALVALLERMR